MVETKSGFVSFYALYCFLLYLSKTDNAGAKELYPFGLSEGDSVLNNTGIDVSSTSINLTEDFHFYNQTIKTVYVGDNGIISLNNSYNHYIPSLLPLNGTQLIVPYWADTDLTGTGNIFYRQSKNPVLLARASHEIQVAFCLSQNISVTNLFIATWDAVGYYHRRTDKTNTFQCVLATVTALKCSFVIFLYPNGKIQWTTGDESGLDGFGGTEALAGINVGDGINNITIPGSLTPSIINIAQTSNVGIPGVWMFQVGKGAPAMVSNILVDQICISVIGNTVTLTLSWGEPFNNLDPIVNYTVSCSGDVTCPPNFTTTDNTTRSYTITNLTPMTNYTFSVVATNSIGSGKAGVVMITTPPGDIITISSVGMTTTTTTTTTSSMGMPTTTTTTTTTSSVGMTTTTSTTTTSSVGMTTTTSSVGMTTTTTTSSVGMTTTTTSNVGMTTTTTSNVGMTTTNTSNVGMTTTTTSSVGMPTTTSSVGITTTTSSVGMPTTTSSVGMTTTTTTSSVGMTTTTPTLSVGATATSSVDNCNRDSNWSGAIIGAVVGVDCVVIIIIVITNIMVWIYCFRKRHHTELHCPPTNQVTNPAYCTITDDHCKKPVEKPSCHYAEVIIPAPQVKMTPNPAYAVP